MVLTKKQQKALARLKAAREKSANKKQRSPVSKAVKTLAHKKWDGASPAQRRTYLAQLARSRTKAKAVLQRKNAAKKATQNRAQRATAREQRADDRELERERRQAAAQAKLRAQGQALRNVKVRRKTDTRTNKAGKKFKVVRAKPLNIF